jgi:hypothetical protein
MRKSFFLPLALLLNACTFNVSMQHSEGSTDTQTENQAASPTVSPNVSIPLAKNEPQDYRPREPDGKNGSDRQYEYQDWS